MLCLFLLCPRAWQPYPWRGLRAFGRVYAGWGLSPAFYQKELWRAQGFSSLEDFLIGSYERGFIRSNANNLFAQSYTWQHADVSANDLYSGELAAALGAIKARTVLMPCTTDRYFTVCRSLQTNSLPPPPPKFSGVARRT